ncbi:MAG: M56 family metallopeptidase [Pirellulaceae bacterium]
MDCAFFPSDGAEVTVPVVIGVVRPLVLVPAAAATGLSSRQLQALLAHELAHLRRQTLP